MLVFYTSNEMFRAKTPWKKLLSEWNFMNFLTLSLSLLGLCYVQPKSGFVIIVFSEKKGLVRSVIQ